MSGDEFIVPQISTIPRLSQRLECMLYRRKLELEVEEIRPDMQTIRDACKDLRSSQRFKMVLQVGYSPSSLDDNAYRLIRLSLL
jgi:diaphanous 1